MDSPLRATVLLTPVTLSVTVASTNSPEGLLSPHCTDPQAQVLEAGFCRSQAEAGQSHQGW
jgi:hypothetical protein